MRKLFIYFIPSLPILHSIQDKKSILLINSFNLVAESKYDTQPGEFNLNSIYLTRHFTHGEGFGF